MRNVEECYKTLTGINMDRLANIHEQRAEVHTTLATERSLHDSIDYKGATTKFQKSVLEWESVNRK